MITEEWRKSSRSNGQGGNCVEVAVRRDMIAVRDSKDPEGPTLTFAPAAWQAFVDGLRVHNGQSGIRPVNVD